jgi:hypothetical protein
MTIQTPTGGNSTPYTIRLRNGVYMTTTFSELEKISVYGFNGDGIVVEGNTPSSNANNCFLKQCESQLNGGSGLLTDGSDGK